MLADSGCKNISNYEWLRVINITRAVIWWGDVHVYRHLILSALPVDLTRMLWGISMTLSHSVLVSLIEWQKCYTAGVKCLVALFCMLMAFEWAKFISDSFGIKDIVYIFAKRVYWTLVSHMLRWQGTDVKMHLGSYAYSNHRKHPLIVFDVMWLFLHL